MYQVNRTKYTTFHLYTLCSDGVFRILNVFESYEELIDYLVSAYFMSPLNDDNGEDNVQSWSNPFGFYRNPKKPNSHTLIRMNLTGKDTYIGYGGRNCRYYLLTDKSGRILDFHNFLPDIKKEYRKEKSKRHFYCKKKTHPYKYRYDPVPNTGKCKRFLPERTIRHWHRAFIEDNIPE